MESETYPTPSHLSIPSYSESEKISGELRELNRQVARVDCILLRIDAWQRLPDPPLLDGTEDICYFVEWRHKMLNKIDSLAHNVDDQGEIDYIARRTTGATFRALEHRLRFGGDTTAGNIVFRSKDEVFRDLRKLYSFAKH